MKKIIIFVVVSIVCLFISNYVVSTQSNSLHQTLSDLEYQCESKASIKDPGSITCVFEAILKKYGFKQEVFITASNISSFIVENSSTMSITEKGIIVAYKQALKYDENYLLYVLGCLFLSLVCGFGALKLYTVRSSD